MIAATASDSWREFWDLWQKEQFWACHEALETLWRDAEQPQKRFLNGLINAAVAVYQARRGNAEGAARQLLRAQIKLRPFQPSRDGVDLDALLQGVEREVARMQSQLTEEQRSRLEQLERQLFEKYTIQ